MIGLTPQGFQAPTTAEVRDLIVADLRAELGPDINVSHDSLLGHLIGIIAERQAELWQSTRAVYRAQYPDGAGGDALDQLGAITGALRLPPTRSRAVVTVRGNPGTTLHPGRVVSTGAGARFVSTKVAVIDDDGTAQVEMLAEELGPAHAPAGTLTKIETPVSGWESVTNGSDAHPGRQVETDTAFRARRDDLLRAVGNGTLEALRAGLLVTGGVTQAKVFENASSTTDAAGLPGKAFEAVVEGGDPDAIRQTIWRTKPAGILAHGAVSGFVADSQGQLQPVRFSRPTAREIYITIEVSPVAGYPGHDALRSAVLAHGRTLGIGDRFVVSQLYPAIFAIGGVASVPSIRVGLAPAPTGTADIILAAREVAALDAQRIDVRWM